MNAIRRSSFFLLVCNLVLVIIIFSMLAPFPVQAGAKQPLLPGGSSLKPGEATLIQMASQVVTINIRQALETDNILVNLSPNLYPLQHNPIWFPAIAEVEADFAMKNPTSKAISLTVWFPLASALGTNEWKMDSAEIVPSIARFQASVNGQRVNHTVSELPNPKGGDKPPLPWASFQVAFPGDAETVIHLSYSLSPQAFSGVEMAFYYVFQTAAGWSGSIGWTELTFNLPYPASAETVAGMPFDSLRLPPYYWPSARADLPAGSSLQGNQVRIRWQDIKPGPGDDLAIWLLQPRVWQELESARAVVAADTRDGRGWLDLASTYYFHLGSEFNGLSIFSPAWLIAGLDAYQQAARLLPNHPAPHAGLALVALAPFLNDKNAPSDVISQAQHECQVAGELDARDPSLMTGAGISRYLLMRCKNALEFYFYNDATAAVEATATSAVEQTANAVMLATTSATPTMTITFTGTPLPSSTPQPLRSPSPAVASQTPAKIQPATGTGSVQSPVIIVAAGILVLFIVVSLALKRARKRTGK